MKKVPNRKRSVKLNKVILQILLLILVSTILITQKENILNTFTNKNKIKAGIPAEMKIGDIIKYDHKTGVKPEDLKTTIGKGTASIPGSGYHLKDSSVQEQTFDASKIDTIWRVFNIDKANNEIMIVSESIYPEFKTYGAIDYIWYEHNMHKIASIFGHGKGAKKKEFTYKVGSQLEDTGDTAIWKTGTNGVPLTGARPFRTEDIEKAFGWTESIIKTDNKFTKNSSGYGVIKTNNIYFPQRDTGSSTQQWADKNIAKAAKKDVKGKDGYYWIKKSDLLENTYKNILWDWNNAGSKNYYQLGQVGLDVYSNYVYFRRGMVYSDDFGSAYNVFVYALTVGSWDEDGNTIPSRVAAFLSSSDIVYRKSSAVGAHQEQIWEIQEKQTLPKGMQIGDIVKYDHKATGVKIEDKRLANLGDNQDLLKTTIEKGTASTPGSTYKQDFDANKIDTNWHVWGVDEVTGDVIIVSDSIYPEFRTKGAIDYIWYEHNMHKIASIFGHGKGAKKKEFTYKVGSQLEDTGDTATWKTGTNGVPLTGARPLRTEDIEKAFGWTESSIKADSNFTRYGNNWGGTTTLNINYPQRKVDGINQTWDNEQIAKGPKKNVTAYNRSYYINKSNVSANTYKNILWDWNNAGSTSYYQLGQVGLDVYSSSVGFRRGVVYSGSFYSASDDFVGAGTDGGWYEYGGAIPSRVAAFLSSSDIVYRKSSAFGAHQEPVWDIELKSPITKNIKVNMKNEFGENLTGVKFNLSVDAGTSVLSRENLTVNSSSVYSFNQSGVVMKDNKYKMEVLGLPAGADYKIISKYEGDHELTQDIVSFGKEDLEYDILIYRKDGDYIVPVKFENGQYDDTFKVSGKLKLMDGNKEYMSKSVELTKTTKEVKFENVNYFIDTTNELRNFKLEFEFDSKSQKHTIDTSGEKIVVKYIPPKKNYDIKAEFIFDKTLDRVPIKLYADGEYLKDIDLLKSEDYIHVENLPARDDSGKEITYTIQKGNIPSGYITEISGLTIIIRPVLTLPMSGSDSIKLIGITAGICTVLGLGVRAKNKIAVFFKKYEMMK